MDFGERDSRRPDEEGRLCRRYKSVAAWRGLDSATLGTLFRHEEIAWEFTALAGHSMSDSDILSELTNSHFEEQVALAGDVGGERRKG